MRWSCDPASHTHLTIRECWVRRLTVVLLKEIMSSSESNQPHHNVTPIACTPAVHTFTHIHTQVMRQPIVHVHAYCRGMHTYTVRPLHRHNYPSVHMHTCTHITTQSQIKTKHSINQAIIEAWDWTWDRWGPAAVLVQSSGSFNLCSPFKQWPNRPELPACKAQGRATAFHGPTWRESMKVEEIHKICTFATLRPLTDAKSHRPVNKSYSKQ